MLKPAEALKMAKDYLKDNGNLCPNCGHELRYNVAHCGTSVTINVFCPTCGERVFVYRECGDNTTDTKTESKPAGDNT